MGDEAIGTAASVKLFYENKITDILSQLQDTVEALEFDFREQLYERQELMRQLLVQLQIKNSEFVEYFTNVQDRNDKKVIELKTDYETKLQKIMHERNELQLNEVVVEKKTSDAMVERNKWQAERADLLHQYHLDQEKIHCFEHQLEILRTENLRSREETLNIEKYLMECRSATEEVDTREKNFTLSLKELQNDCELLNDRCKENDERIAF